MYSSDIYVHAANLIDIGNTFPTLLITTLSNEHILQNIHQSKAIYRSINDLTLKPQRDKCVTSKLTLTSPSKPQYLIILQSPKKPYHPYHNTN